METAKITNFESFDFEQVGGTPPTKNAIVHLREDSEISDGYHTMKELYEHRYELFIALCRSRVNTKDSGGEEFFQDVWRSKLHADGTMYEGYFVLGIGFRVGKQITYHLPMRLWDQTNFAQTLDQGPEFDGHTPADVLTRLSQL